VLSTVGLVPAALQGLDIDALLGGAAAMDVETRKQDTSKNAAMQLAIAWHSATNGKGEKDMVVLPYKDSLVLFRRTSPDNQGFTTHVATGKKLPNGSGNAFIAKGEPPVILR